MPGSRSITMPPPTTTQAPASSGYRWEVAVWEDLITVEGDEGYLTYQVYNEAIVVPETVDAISALTESAPDAASSMAITDVTLGIRKEFLSGATAINSGRRP